MADRGLILHKILVWNLILCSCLVWAKPQSNYADRGVDIEYHGNGLPEEAVLDGKVTKLDELSHVIFTNRTTASLSCASRAMEVDLEFAEPFFGIVYADFNRQSPCSFTGKGQTKYHYELPLSGCGTIQDPLRVFTNNIIVRFHPWLELEGDEVKTIVCRYPPPIVPPPAAAPLPIKEAVPPLETKPESLGELQILLIICALLFLALMLFGVACSYFCLKQRNIKLIRRRRALSSGPGSAITKMSDSTLNLPMFDGLKIPRAHPPSTSGSEQALINVPGGVSPAGHSDTLPSDYPSESRSSSEVEEGDTRSLRRPSTVSSAPIREEQQMMEMDNQGFVHSADDRLSSVYSDTHAQIDVDMVGAPIAIPRVEPSFDVAFRIKERRRSPAPSPTPSSVISEPDNRTSVMRAQERTLTTILEREEWRGSESGAAMARYAPNPPLNTPPVGTAGPPASYAQVKRKPVSEKARSDSSMYTLSQRSIPENDTWSTGEHLDIPDGRSPLRASPARSLASLNTEMTDPHSVNEIIMKSTRPFKKSPAPKPPSLISDYPSEGRALSEYQENNRTLIINEDIQIHTSTDRNVQEDEETETMIIPTPERPVPPPKSASLVSEYASEDRAVSDFGPQGQLLPRTPKLTTHEVDDVFLKTITETRIVEDEERIRREITEYHKRPRQPALPPNWDVTIRNYPGPVTHEERTPSESTVWDRYSQSDVVSERPRSTVETDRFSFAQPIEQPVINWDVLIRVLNPPPDDDATSILTVEDREKWHQIITTESTLRSLLTEAVVREDYERIRHDHRFEQIFEPKKWDVIIRVLAPPPMDDFSDTRSETTVNSEPIRRYRKRSDIDPRSRRSSLAPVQETDQPGYGVRGPGSTRSGITSQSSIKSDYDLRSLTETTVNYAKYEPDIWSESSGHTFRSSLYPRSTADRSHSEIMERQAYPEDWDHSDAESGRMSRPSLARSTSEFTENWQRVPFDRMSSVSGYSYSSSTGRRPVLERSSTEVLEDVPQMSPGYAGSENNSMDSSPPQYRRGRIPYERVSSSGGESVGSGSGSGSASGLLKK